MVQDQARGPSALIMEGIRKWPSSSDSPSPRGSRSSAKFNPPILDPEAYADGVVARIRHLLASRYCVKCHRNRRFEGFGPRDADFDPPPGGHSYVLLANCNEYVVKTFSLSLHGDVLSIYEDSDGLGTTLSSAVGIGHPELGKQREVRLEPGFDTGSSSDRLKCGCGQP